MCLFLPALPQACLSTVKSSGGEEVKEAPREPRPAERSSSSPQDISSLGFRMQIGWLCPVLLFLTVQMGRQTQRAAMSIVMGLSP